jgi:hypothetical protein
MGFTIPNNDLAFNANQSRIFEADLKILAQGINGEGVIGGCAVTAQGSPDMTLAVAAGTVIVAGVPVAVTAGNVTITTADGSNPRIDLVVVNNAGTKSVTAGTAAASPKAPDVPASSVCLAMVYVPANDTAIASNQITDKRCVMPLGFPITIYKTADETVTSSATLQDDNHLTFPIGANETWVVEFGLFYFALAAADIKKSISVPSGATFRFGQQGILFTVAAHFGDGDNLSAGSSSSYATAGSDTNDVMTTFAGMIFNGSTAGNVTLQWAQNTSNGSGTTLYKGSFLRARRVA